MLSYFHQSANWIDFKSQIDVCSTTKEKGDAFELLTKLYLKIDPKYKTIFRDVWLYNEVPTNTLKKLNLPTKDMGIDIIAETKQGEYWAVQCKYKSDETKSLSWREISTFQSLAFSKARGISVGLVATTADRASTLFKDQKESVSLLSGEVWRSLDEEFFDHAKKLLAGNTVIPKPFTPKKHQKRAIKNASQHFIREKASKGKMIMPCGTGKSLTAYWIARELNAKTIVVAVPSLALINQTLNAWLREVVANKQEVDWIAVCSDKSVGEVDSAITTQNLGIPTNTDPEVIAKWLRKRSSGLKVVFTTYQSGKVLAEAARASKRVFDLGIMDEAHKTVGDREKSFAHLLFDENIKIRKRVFMTATERRYSGNRDEIISMDDPEVYGDTFELLSFKEALEQDPPILSDYKILTMMIGREDIAQYVEQHSIVKPDRGKWDDGVQAEMLAGVVALQKAMQKYPIHHAVSFHTSIAKAQAFQRNQQIYSDEVNAETNALETYFVSGKTPTSIRSRKIKEFAESEKAIISNARCLTEGVDVPNIDGVLFADPKRSAVDIVQAVGRTLRTSEGKEFGYVIIPVLVEDEADFENSGAFQTILTVLRALASNDERIVEYFRDRGNRTQPGNNQYISDVTASLIDRIDLDEFIESIELKTWDRLAKLNWRPFEEARAFVRSLNFASQKDWKTYCRSDVVNHKPSDIPTHPHVIYANDGWLDWGDWFGSGFVATKLRDYRPFIQARLFAQKLGLKNQKEWGLYVRGELPEFDDKPDDIPANPDQVYKNNGWLSLGDWLGTGTIASQNRKYLSFASARKFVHGLNLKNQKAWSNYCKGLNIKLGQKPTNIPTKPERVYKETGWKNLADWLGTQSVGTRDRDYLQFEKAREFVHKLKLQSHKEWMAYCRGEKSYLPDKPLNIPSGVSSVYKNSGWVSWGDWLGNSNRRIFLPFNQARMFARGLNLKTASQWREYSRSGGKPHDIPVNPHVVYKKTGWISWGNWLGSGNIATNKNNYRSYKDAKSFIVNLGITSHSMWLNYVNNKISGFPKLPNDIPKAPHIVYTNRGDWISWPDFLGYEPKTKKK